MVQIAWWVQPTDTQHTDNLRFTIKRMRDAVFSKELASDHAGSGNRQMPPKLTLVPGAAFDLIASLVETLSSYASCKLTVILRRRGWQCAVRDAAHVFSAI